MQTPQVPLQAQNNIRVAILGVGNIGSAHAATIYSGQVEGMTLAALCDHSPEVEAICREKYPDVAFYQSAEALLESDVDAVVIALPHPLHASLGIAAFQKGKHVLVEKPMDISLSQGLALAEEAKKSGKLFGIMFNQRTGNLFQKAKEILESGALGQLKRSVWLITNWYRTQHYYDSGVWRATWKGEGGGVLMNQCPHQLDLWQWICGMPVSVTAFCEEGKYHDIEVEDNVTLLCKFAGGADGAFITSTGEFPGTNRLELSGTLGKLVLEEGKLKWWRLEQDERQVCLESGENAPGIPYTYEEFTQEKKNGHQAILQNFANALLRGEPLLAPGYEGLHQLTLQNAAYLSAWEGNRPVDIPFDPARYDALLAKKQATSAVRTQGKGHTHSESYSHRWQINW